MRTTSSFSCHTCQVHVEGNVGEGNYGRKAKLGMLVGINLADLQLDSISATPFCIGPHVQRMEVAKMFTDQQIFGDEN